MSYGLAVTPQALDVLEKEGVDYTFFDVNELLEDKETAEVMFDTIEKRNRAIEVIKGGNIK